MQTHAGRSVTRVTVGGETHFLKRFWLTPKQVFRRFVAQGMHELAMIDWLNANHFTGPEVVARGVQRRFGIPIKMLFLMREASGETPLERFCRKHSSDRDAVFRDLAIHSARLHDAGFYHRDYSERHIFVRREEGGFGFRQIDLERASAGKRREQKAAADLKTLACSIADSDLSAQIEGSFLDVYLDRRTTVGSTDSFRKLLAAAAPTKSFE